MSNHNCRVCGLYIEDFPWGDDGNCPTYEICPCCGAKTEKTIPSKRGRIGRLGDGRRINVRNGSSTKDNEPTLEIINKDGSKIKFRYER